MVADFSHLVERLLVGPHGILADLAGKQHAPIACVALVGAMGRVIGAAELAEIDVRERNVEGRGVGGSVSTLAFADEAMTVSPARTVTVPA